MRFKRPLGVYNSTLISKRIVRCRCRLGLRCTITKWIIARWCWVGRRICRCRRISKGIVGRWCRSDRFGHRLGLTLVQVRPIAKWVVDRRYRSWRCIRRRGGDSRSIANALLVPEPLHFHVLATRSQSGFAPNRLDLTADWALDSLQSFAHIDHLLAIDFHLGSLLKIAGSCLRIARQGRLAQSSVIISSRVLAPCSNRLIELLLGCRCIASEISMHGMAVHIIKGILGPSRNRNHR